MTYPRELKEITRLGEKAYPFQFFLNGSSTGKSGQTILYLHWHEHFEIIFMQEGNAVFHINSEAHEASPGDVLFVPAGALHVGYCISDGPIRYAAFVFSPSLFHDWTHDPNHEELVAPYMESRKQFPVMPIKHSAGCAEHFQLIERAIEEFHQQRPGYKLIIKSQLYLLFAQLARILLPEQLAGKKQRMSLHNRERFKALVHYMEKHYHEKMTVDEAAAFVKLNPYHFCKTFKKLTGRTFIEYLNVIRMNEAEKLIHESGHSITEIAGLVGCDNPNYFTKLFKQHKGSTPSALRK